MTGPRVAQRDVPDFMRNSHARPRLSLEAGVKHAFAGRNCLCIAIRLGLTLRQVFVQHSNETEPGINFFQAIKHANDVGALKMIVELVTESACYLLYFGKCSAMDTHSLTS